MEGPPIENGAVVVRDGRIQAVGSHDHISRLFPTKEAVDLGEQVLLPGLINAHCHLDYSMMRYAIAPQKTFAEWIVMINAMKREFTDEDYLQAIARGFVELKKWGTTTVLNIETFPELIPKMPAPPIRTWWFYELIDIRHRFTTDELVAGAFAFFNDRPDWLGGFGLSPHAPYTASLDLYRLAGECSQLTGMPLTTHLAESWEEDQMFRHGRGPLHDFLSSLGRAMHDCGQRSAFAHLMQNNSFGAEWILAHVNELGPDDFMLISERQLGPSLHIVHCPVSHLYFRHTKFEFKRLRDLGANISLGTDSLASNDALNLFTEMQVVQRKEPWLRPEELLGMVTVNAARALQREDVLGKITPGAHADLISLPFSGRLETVYDWIVNYQKPIDWMMVDGKISA